MAYPRFSARFWGTSVASLAGLSLAFCAACGGSSFDAGGSAGAGASAGGSGATGGSSSSAGTGAGGASAGSGTGGSSTGGGTGEAGTSAGGSMSMGGTSSGGSSTGGTSSGGAGASGGSGGAVDCAALKADYAATVQKARVCDMGSTDECSTSSTMPAFGCGCPTLVNAKSPYTDSAKKKYKAIQDAMCEGGPICNIACIAQTSASCSAETTSAGTVYECVGSMGITAN